MSPKTIAIIGGGPAGLMAAQQLVGRGLDVHLFDAMPSLGRKFLMAGKSGMNLTHNEDLDRFLTRYHDDEGRLQPLIQGFTPEDIRAWAKDLGIETFVGSSGRIFPTDFKAAPLLRSWLKQLRSKGLTIHVRHKWTGWQGDDLVFDAPEGEKRVRAAATIFALGGKSWSRLGSDGSWVSPLEEMGFQVSPFKPSNCGFETEWTEVFRDKFAGAPVKSVGLTVGDVSTKGEFVVSSFGVEGSAIYTHSRALRTAIEQKGHAVISLDLCPDRALDDVLQKLLKPRGRKSISTHLKRTLGLDGVKAGLLRECSPKETFGDMEKLAQAIKSLPLKLDSPRPMDEAISTAGGLSFNMLDDNMMLTDRTGLFFAGEMLDWDAPTGGYLLTACFATGRAAGLGALHWLKA